VSKMQENCTASTQASPETRPPCRRSPAFSTMRRGRRGGRRSLLERVVAREAGAHGELLGDGREAGGARRQLGRALGCGALLIVGDGGGTGCLHAAERGCPLERV